MEPHYPNMSLSLVLSLAINWIRTQAQRHQEEETARTAPKEEARNNGSVRPGLSRGDFQLLYKELNNSFPWLRSDEWFSDFKRDFERVQVHKKIKTDAEYFGIKTREQERRARLREELMTP